MANRYGAPTLRAFRNVFCDGIVKEKFALLDKHHHGGCCDLLRYRAYLEHRRGSDGLCKLDIRESVAAFLYNASITHDCEREAGYVAQLHLFTHVIVRIVRAH